MGHGWDAMSFRIEREDGAQLDVAFTMHQMADVLSFLFRLARAVHRPAEMPPLKGTKSLAPIEIDGIALGVGVDPNQTVMVARIGSFDLGLSIPNSALAEFGLELAQKAQALSASPDRNH